MQPPDSEHGPDRLIWLTKMYHAYATNLQRYIYSKVGDPFLAEDLTSTVFLKALRWLREDQSEESARGWLYATARTSIADSWQTASYAETLALTDIEDQLIPQMENADLVQKRAEARVQHLLNLLSERDRRVLTLRYLQGYSAAEIAAALGTNTGHIRVLQLRALKRAAQLEKQERNFHTMQEQNTSSFDSYAQLLSPESMHVFALAREEALNLNHNFIGTEHVLWGLTSEGSLSFFLAPLNITLEKVHTGVVFIYSRQAQWTQANSQETPPVDADTLPGPLKILTPRTQQVIVLAGKEMQSQGEQSIRPAHLLTGLIDEGSGIGAGLLRSMGVNLLQTRSALVPSNGAQICSFCGRNGSMVKHIFTAEVSSGNTTPSVFICDQCVERFHTLLGQSYRNAG
ncbi:MAG: sigma-70 family RNA polymerase sigma factor [Ktedonobacteraceae bacterium]|nr:sigma-70 family RNA polymerase sigma factor [Ktedonobacteraceae bacterium]